MRCGGWWVLFVALGVTACGGQDQTAPLDWPLQTTVFDTKLENQQGVNVCVDGHPDIPCATTDKDGKATLELPSGEDLLVSYEKAGFYTKLFEISTKEDPRPRSLMLPRRSWYESEAAKLGGQGALDLDTMGMVSLQANHSGDGLKFELQQRPVGSPPPAYMYVVSYGSHVAFCTQSSTCDSLGLVDYGVVAFVNVPPGDYKAAIDTNGTAEGSAMQCTRTGFECPDDPSNCVKMHVEAGKITFAGVTCK